MIISRKNRSIPSCLSHYTSEDGLKGICCKEYICIRAYSNQCKNDQEEIKIGKKILDCARVSFDTKQRFRNLLDYQKSASISFTENGTTDYMVKEYGGYRLDFDLRDYKSREIICDHVFECEYVNGNDIDVYACEYSQFIKNNYTIMHEHPADLLERLEDHIMMENDLILKPFLVKKDVWGNEKEWRLIFFLGESTNLDDDKPYKNIEIPKKTLKRVVIVVACGCFWSGLKKWFEIIMLLYGRGYYIPIVMKNIKK
jgi:hypothetical protein